MRRFKLLAVLLLSTMSANSLSAQKEGGILSYLEERVVVPLGGYYYTPAYPVGLYCVVNGYFVFPPVRVGFNFCPKDDVISESEYREPTWTLQLCPMLAFGFDRNYEYGWLIGFDVGADFVRRSITDPITAEVLDTKCTPYFSFTLKTGFVFRGGLDFIVGYEWVPAYKHLSGFSFGLGLSIPPH